MREHDMSVGDVRGVMILRCAGATRSKWMPGVVLQKSNSPILGVSGLPLPQVPRVAALPGEAAASPATLRILRRIRHGADSNTT